VNKNLIRQQKFLQEHTLTPEKRAKLIEEKLKRAEALLKEIMEKDKKLSKD